MRYLVLTIFVVACFLSQSAGAADVWGPTPEAPWPIEGRDVKNTRNIPGTPEVSSPLHDYDLAWVYDWYDNQAAEFIIADVDGNGNQDILLVHGGDGYLAAVEAFHGPLWVFADPDDSSWTYSVPAIGDKDGDGELEIVYGRRSGKVYQVGGDGALDWKHELEPSEGRPLMVDLNNDGRYVSLVPTMRPGVTTETSDPRPDSTLHAFDSDGRINGIGTIHQGAAVDPFTVWMPDESGIPHVLAAPLMFIPEDEDPCRIDCPPSPVQTHLAHLAMLPHGNHLEPLDVDDLTVFVQKSNDLAFTGRAGSGPILVDLTADGWDEAVLALGAKQGYPGVMHSDNGQIVVLDRNLDVLDVYVPQSPQFRKAAAADILQDGTPELLLGTYDGLEIVRWNGERLELVKELKIGTVTNIAAADLDGDQRYEIVVTTSYYTDPSRTGSVLVIDDDYTVRELIEASGPHRGRDSFIHVAIADMDGDGTLDIVAYSYNGLIYLFSATRGIGLHLEAEALAARLGPGFVRDHERMLMGASEDPEVQEATVRIGTFVMVLALLGLGRLASRPRFH